MSSPRSWTESKLGRRELRSFAIGWLADQRRERREREGEEEEEEGYSYNRQPLALATVTVVAQPHRPSIGQSKWITYYLCISLVPRLSV